MAKDPAILAHQEWLGYVQPVGLVVSIPALLEANARINQNFAPEHRRFLDALPADATGEPIPEIPDFPAFAEAVLGWAPGDLYGAPASPAVPECLEVPLPEYGETLRPTYALREFQPAEGASEWIMLVKVLPRGVNFDQVMDGDTRHWQASPQAKFERLLRKVQVPIGLLVNHEQVRLVYAPEKELSGHITFKLAEMVKVAGRPIFAAFQMLLCADRLYNVAERERLPAILESSRKYQNVVSTQLADQVLEALYELLRGFQAANDQSQDALLRDVLRQDPDIVYRGLLTTLLRLVFILYAEDRDLLSTDPVYTNYYSVTGLYERLQVDNGRYPDTMDQRFGAWAQLLTLFRLIYRGGSHGNLRIPAREGYLFDPDRYPFLEGRQNRADAIKIPRVSDGVLFRVLSKLMLLDGERISYRTLAVEQIGSVYEAIMGFELHVASGRSIAIKPAKRHGAPTTINLEELLATAPDKRLKWFLDHTDQKLTGAAADALKAETDINSLMLALDRRIAKSVTPDIVAKDAMIFQPSNERRRSGSHYTPSSLTGPIVEAALAPVLKQLGDNPTPAQILNLKVCDPAVGSGAFLVEACRQLGEVLSKAWHAHNEAPILPPDEDEFLHAQRQIAQRCLYGVDKNPMATDLAKLSLWLATLAKDHAFTFLDHSLRTGDSLVGLTQKQIAAFNWNEDDEQQSFLEAEIRQRVERVSRYRQRILAARDDVPYAQLKQELEGAEETLQLLRQVGDTVIAAFFSADKTKARENERLALRHLTELSIRDVTDQKSFSKIDEARRNLHRESNGVRPFHWELEFPEVFRLDMQGARTGGFDVIVGNPPFLGGARIWPTLGGGYTAWIRHLHPNSEGKAVDLVAHFFRRAFSLLRLGGCFGLIATNSIAQGDTREAGLKQICKSGGQIYAATRRLRWPGDAAVIVSVVSVIKDRHIGEINLNGRPVPALNSFLFPSKIEFDPVPLAANADASFQGACVLGMGFTFDDSDTTGTASSITAMHDLLRRDSKNAERIFPYIGGKEINSNPELLHHRYVIDFEDMSLEEASRWPELLDIVRNRVKPDRGKIGGYSVAERRKEYWWQFGTATPALNKAKIGLTQVLTIARISNAFALAFLPAAVVCNEKTIVFTFETHAAFATLQCRVHEIWARFFGSTLKDDFQYTPSDCFETFPFPENWVRHPQLNSIGKNYYEFRAGLMAKYREGLTTTYNRFHDPNEISGDIQSLRSLHAAMDRAVLDAYGWQDIQSVCDFLPEFDDVEDEDENGSPKRKKFRYRWPDEIHDEVLARLLDLNRKRALEEGQVAAAMASVENGTRAPKQLRKKSGGKRGAAESEARPTLFATEE